MGAGLVIIGVSGCISSACSRIGSWTASCGGGGDRGVSLRPYGLASPSPSLDAPSAPFWARSSTRRSESDGRGRLLLAALCAGDSASVFILVGGVLPRAEGVMAWIKAAHGADRAGPGAAFVDRKVLPSIGHAQFSDSTLRACLGRPFQRLVFAGSVGPPQRACCSLPPHPGVPLQATAGRGKT